MALCGPSLSRRELQVANRLAASPQQAMMAWDGTMPPWHQRAQPADAVADPPGLQAAHDAAGQHQRQHPGAPCHPVAQVAAVVLIVNVKEGYVVLRDPGRIARNVERLRMMNSWKIAQ